MVSTFISSSKGFRNETIMDLSNCIMKMGKGSRGGYRRSLIHFLPQKCFITKYFY